MNKRFTLNHENIFALCILVFLFTLVFYSILLPFRTKLLPLLVAWITIILTIIEIIMNNNKVIKEEQQTLRVFDKRTIRGVGISIAFMLSTIILWQLIGYIIGSIIIIVSFCLFLGVKKNIKLLVIALIFTVLSYAAFHTFLKVPLPNGLIISKFI